jgi:hypothetical protein
LQIHPNVSRLRLNDSLPGAKIETFCLPTGGFFFIMRIAVQTPAVAPRLFVRCDKNGQMFAAIAKAGAQTGDSEQEQAGSDPAIG